MHCISNRAPHFTIWDSPAIKTIFLQRRHRNAGELRDCLFREPKGVIIHSSSKKKWLPSLTTTFFSFPAFFPRDFFRFCPVPLEMTDAQSIIFRYIWHRSSLKYFFCFFRHCTTCFNHSYTFFIFYTLYCTL